MLGQIEIYKQNKTRIFYAKVEVFTKARDWVASLHRSSSSILHLIRHSFVATVIDIVVVGGFYVMFEGEI